MSYFAPYTQYPVGRMLHYLVLQREPGARTLIDQLTGHIRTLITLAETDQDKFIQVGCKLNEW